MFPYKPPQDVFVSAVFLDRGEPQDTRQNHPIKLYRAWKWFREFYPFVHPFPGGVELYDPTFPRIAGVRPAPIS